jgi:ABC-2 type transport system permease protein
MEAVALLQTRQILGEKKIFLLMLFLAIPVVLSLIVRVAGGIPPGELELAGGTFLYLLYPQTIVMLLGLLYGTSIVNAELEGKTLTYLFTRPLPKWKIVVSKFAAIGVCISVPSIVSLSISFVILNFPGGGVLFVGLTLGTVAAVLTYTAIFAAIGTFFQRRPMIVGFVYGAIELVLSFVPALVSSLTVTYFLRSLVMRIVNPALPPDFPKEVLRMLGDAPLATTLLAIVGMIAGALALSSYVTTKKEYVITEQV